MSADYLDLLLGRARGELPAAEPRILSSMAPAATLPWEEITEERIASPSSQAALPSLSQPAPLAWTEKHLSHQSPSEFPSTRPVPPQPTSETSPKPSTTQLSPQRNTVHPTGQSPSPDFAQPSLQKEAVLTRELVPIPTPAPIAEATKSSLGPPMFTPPSTEGPRPPLAQTLLPPRESTIKTPARQASAPANSSRSEPTAPAPITIRIDRIEVRSATPSSPPRPAHSDRPASAIPLDDYLGRHKGAGR